MNSSPVEYSQPPARGLQLNRVVLLGRTFEEYCRFFGIGIEELREKKIVDVASGVSSFRAEGSALGLDITALDPIYDRSPASIRPVAEADLDYVHQGVANLPTYRWNFYRDPDQMRRFREKALGVFLQDYQNKRETKYIVGALPDLPFADHQFDLALVSYFLFAYETQLDYDFHRNSIRDLLRVAREARIYPTVTFAAERSAWLDPLMNDPILSHLHFEEVATDFEFLANSNSYLRVSRR